MLLFEKIGNKAMTEGRNEQGKFLARPDSLSKPIGLRIRKDLQPLLAELAAEVGLTPGQWCRQQIEAAIASATKSKANVKKSKLKIETTDNHG
jgi:hypothetical protein